MTIENVISIKDFVRMQRVKKKITMKQLSEILNKTPQAIYKNLENGTLTIQEFRAIANLFNLSNVEIVRCIRGLSYEVL